MNPSVSVIIPTHNRAPLLREAMASVLHQTYAPREILIVDDGSTDQTREIVRALGDAAQYFFQTNRGPAAARNMGIQKARGDVVAFLDDDDLWVPEALEWRIARLMDTRAPPAQIVLGLTQRVNMTDLEPVFSPWAARVFGSAVMRREVFTQIGLLDEELQYGEDGDWFLRAREQEISLVFVPQVVMLYRIHAQSLMSDTRRAKWYMLQVVKKSLARRTDVGTGNVQLLAELPEVQELSDIVQGKRE